MILKEDCDPGLFCPPDQLFHTLDRRRAALRQIAAGGVTMLLVEQNTHRALDFVERAYVLENGRTVLEGRSAELLRSPEISKVFLGG